jgi:hypothetical protein
MNRLVKETAVRLRTGPTFAVPPTMLRSRPADESCLSVFDDYLWWRLPWRLDECLSTLPAARQSTRGTGLRTGPTFAVPPTMLRSRPADERDWSGWTPMEAQGHGAWMNAFRLSQQLAKVPGGLVRHPPVFQACASIRAAGRVERHSSRRHGKRHQR